MQAELSELAILKREVARDVTIYPLWRSLGYLSVGL